MYEPIRDHLRTSMTHKNLQKYAGTLTNSGIPLQRRDL